MTSATVSRLFKGRSALPALLLFAIVFLAFLPAVFNGFTTYDDPEYVTANPHVRAGLTPEGFVWAFRPHGANWHPVTWLSHMLDGQFFGLRPKGHHLVNVLLHALNAALAFAALRRMTDCGGRSFAVALLFGLHPLRVESVAWVAERKDVLSVFFGMLTLLAYGAYARQDGPPAAKGRKKQYAMALFFFTLGLLSKSMLVTLPFVLLLLDFWPLGRFKNPGPARLVLEKLPFLAVSAAMSLIAYLSQAHGAAVVSDLSFSNRFDNALVSYCRYLGVIFMPRGLCAIYPYPPAWPVAIVVCSGLLLAAVSLIALLQLRHRAWLATGWFWFLGTLVPVIGLVQIGNQSMADRYTYLPSLGLFIALVWAAGEFTRNLRRQAAILPLATAALAIACAILTVRQIRFWKDTESLFQRAVDVTQGNTLALTGLGVCLAGRGDLDGAIALYHQAIQTAPGYYEPHFNLGLALLGKNRLDDAIAEFHSALDSRPDSPDAHLNLGVALARKGLTAEAIAQFEKTAALDPASQSPHSNIGKLRMGEKNFPAALVQFQQAARLAPDDFQAHCDLGSALAAAGQFAGAAEEYRAALRLVPDNAEIHNNLGITLANQGDLDGAATEFQAALTLNPNHAPASANLARILKIKSQPNR